MSKKVNSNKLLSIISVGINYREIIDTFNSINFLTKEDWIEYIIVSPNITTLKNILVNNKIIYKCDSSNGCYFAMNQGLKIATGKYIWFLNSGDYATKFNEDFLIILKKWLSKNNKILFFDQKLFKLNNLTSKINLKNNRLFKIVFSSLIMPISHQNILIPRIYQKEFNTKLKYNADFEILNKIIEDENIKIKFINLKLAILTPGGISDKYRFEVIFERFKIMFNKKQIYRKLYSILSLIYRVIYLILTKIIKFLIKK